MCIGFCNAYTFSLVDECFAAGNIMLAVEEEIGVAFASFGVVDIGLGQFDGNSRTVVVGFNHTVEIVFLRKFCSQCGLDGELSLPTLRTNAFGNVELIDITSMGNGRLSGKSAPSIVGKPCCPLDEVCSVVNILPEV